MPEWIIHIIVRIITAVAIPWLQKLIGVPQQAVDDIQRVKLGARKKIKKICDGVACGHYKVVKK